MRWLAGFWIIVFSILLLQMTVIFESNIFNCCIQNQSLGMLGPPLWHPGGPWDDPEALASTRKEILGSRHGLYEILNGFLDPMLRDSRVLWIKVCVLFHACFQAIFSHVAWGSEKICDVRGVAKPIFDR